jgi:DNA polymerase III delta prime subunit
MNKLDINKILNREEQERKIKSILKDFEDNKNNLLFKKGIYVYGEPGSGKTSFVTNILKELNYDIVNYDAGDIRNTSVIDDITRHNMADKNIMSLFNKKVRKIAIIMDEIDGMNSGDKGGINSLIKLIRPKKTKKQKLEEITVNPIVCIGNYKVDKKIKELMKICNTIELKKPSESQILNIINIILPNMNIEIINKLVNYIQGDLRKLNSMINLYNKNSNILTEKTITNILEMKHYNDDTKKITNKLINDYYPLNQHNNIMNETDRTSVGLLWHENIIDMIEKIDKKQSIPFYIKQLDNICFSDYIDRITFQKQIWQFNEMSSLIKTFKNNKLYHNTFVNKKPFNSSEVRFTKVLTKYSTEYNNSIFIQRLCQKLGMDKKDLFGFFIELSNNYEYLKIISLLEDYEISKLDINRIYRYVEKYIKENAEGTADKEVEIEDEDECDENYE